MASETLGMIIEMMRSQPVLDGLSFVDMRARFEALAEFYIANSRRMAQAGKLLFPIPNRRLSKRLYRVTAETLVVWGKSDRLMPVAYGERFRDAIRGARLVTVEEAGHMVPYEQPDVFVSLVAGFLG